MLNCHLLFYRVTCEHYFTQFTELDRILNFSTPKVLRLIEIIRQFRPKKAPDLQSVEIPAAPQGGESNSGELNCPEENPSSSTQLLDDNDKESEDFQAAVSILNEVRITELTDDNEETVTDGNRLVINHWNNEGNLNDTVSVISSKGNGQSMSIVDKADVFKDAQEFLEDKDDWQDCLSELITSWVDPLFSCHLGSNGDNNSSSREQVKEISDNESSVQKENLDWGQVPGGPSWLSVDVDEPSPYLKVEDLFPKTNPSSRKSKKREKYFQRFENYDPVEGWKNNNFKLPDNELSPINRESPAGAANEKTLVKWKGRGKAWRLAKKEQRKNYSLDDADSLVGIIFVERRFTAKVLFHLLNVSTYFPVFTYLLLIR